jgi:hypothetical protein
VSVYWTSAARAIITRGIGPKAFNNLIEKEKCAKRQSKQGTLDFSS